MLTFLACLLFLGASSGLVAWIAFQSEREQMRTGHADYREQQAKMIQAAAQELRQPLNSVVGLVHALQTTLRKAALDKDGVSEKLDGSLRELNDALLQALAVFDLSNGVGDFDLSPVDIRTEIKTLIRKCNKDLLKRQANIKIVVSYIPEVWVETDVVRFRECVNVLLNQAVAQTQEGSIRVSFAVQEQADGIYRVALAIKDNGPGMDQRRARTYFRPADYEDNPALRGSPGTMLSLNLAARSAQLLGGSMVAKSAVGVGTTFVLTIRAKVCEPVPDLAEEGNDPPIDMNPDFAALSVLLVDDNETNLFVLQELVLPLGFGRVVTADGGQKAIDRAFSEPFDLILMDLAMPHTDGFVAAARIREGGPSQSAPIIAVSGMPMRTDDRALKQAGIDGFVPKPIVPGDLLAAILKVLPEVMQHADERGATNQSSGGRLRLAAG